MKKLLVLLLIFFNSAAASELPVTSEFGWRVHPISGEWKFHSGVDLGFEYGTGIAALFDGEVIISADLNDGYGNQILIYHEQLDAYTRYAHCAELFVAAGEKVQAGDLIATVGSSGYSTGPHLHLEYIISDLQGGYIYINPLILWE